MLYSWKVFKITSTLTINSVWETGLRPFYKYNLCFLSVLLNIEKAKSADEKFNKLKVLYGKLRQDHIELLRKVRFRFFVFVNSRVTYSVEVRGDVLLSCNDVSSNGLKWKWTQKAFHSNLVRLEKTDFIWQLCRYKTWRLPGLIVELFWFRSLFLVLRCL